MKADLDHDRRTVESIVSRVRYDAPSVRDIARDAYKRAGRDVKRAARAMEKNIRGDETLLLELSEEFIRMVCVVATGVVMREDRRKAWLPPNYDAGGNGDRIYVLARSNDAMLMEMRLPGGKPLGDATGSEVSDAAAWYAKHAGNMAHKSRWLERITRIVTKTATVRSKLTEETLRKLQKESADA